MTTLQWNDGYATDHEYSLHFDPDLAPERLNFACWQKGIEPVALDQPFCYFELGCGHGFTSTLLAAAHPHGKFFANDFMPTHIANAQRLASMAGLSNLQLLENSFEELALGQVDLPAFDFITMQGVYAWVSPEKQAQIVGFLARYLKPGGVVFVTYNALPGWSAATHMQRLMYESTRLHPGADSVTKLRFAKELVNQMVTAGSQYFSAHTDLQRYFDKLETYPQGYLIHEFLHEKSSPKYHAEVVDEFARAKLEYLTCVSPEPTLPSQQQELIDAVADPVLRRTVEDFMRNRNFREDIFVRGRRNSWNPNLSDEFDKFTLALCVPRPSASNKLNQPWIQAPLDALAKAPRRLSELAQWPGFADDSALVLSLIEIVQRSKQGSVFMQRRTEPDHGPAHRLNATIAKLSCYKDQYQAFASPVLGTGVQATLTERLVYLQLTESPQETQASVIGERVWNILKRHHTPPNKPTPELDEIVSRVQSILDHSLPMWLQTGVI